MTKYRTPVKTSVLYHILVQTNLSEQRGNWLGSLWMFISVTVKLKLDLSFRNKLEKCCLHITQLWFVILITDTWRIKRCSIIISHRNSWYMAWDGHWAHTRDWQAYHHYHRRHPGDNIPFPTLFHGSTKRKCGFFPQHNGHRVNCRFFNLPHGNDK